MPRSLSLSTGPCKFSPFLRNRTITCDFKNISSFPCLIILLLSAGCGARPEQCKTCHSHPGYHYRYAACHLYPPPPSDDSSSTSPSTDNCSREGVSSTQINVRSEPSTAAMFLGSFPPTSRVQIAGKDPGRKLVADPLRHKGVDGKGWVTAQYVTTQAHPSPCDRRRLERIQ